MTFKNQISNLIKVDRNRTSTSGRKNPTLLTESLSDKGRLLYSAAFRRLQSKAQVFSLESNAAVRSRLTHSLEVAHIGRYLVDSIVRKIDILKEGPCEGIEEDIAFWKKESAAIANLVEVSCLMHDIGNPPFGHFGEAAIKNWATSEGLKNCLKLALNLGEIQKEHNNLIADFKMFDGNPQGLRIITKLQGDDALNGLNLTYSQILSLLKYTHSHQDVDPSQKDIPFKKKIGYFTTEKEIVTNAWKSLEMNGNTRHPLSFLMEAADDISYCISDIEDGLEKKIITEEVFFNEIKNELNKMKNDSLLEEIIKVLDEKQSAESSISKFLLFKTTLTNSLVERTATTFIAQYLAIKDGDLEVPLISEKHLEIEYKILEALRKFTTKHLFSSDEAETIELSGYSVILGILEKYEPLLKLPQNDFGSLFGGELKGGKSSGTHIDLERRLFNRLPEKHKNAYKAAIAGISALEPNFKWQFEKNFSDFNKQQEWKLRVHLILDFISGMTDQFSLEFYQMLIGTNIKR